MFTKAMQPDPHPSPPNPKEGDLFKIIHLYGKTFEIRYGFYEECDRYTLFAEPLALYPNFIKNPQYTDNGIPFVTAIQDPCPHFQGKRDDNCTCGDCVFYQHCDEMIGICLNAANQQIHSIPPNE